MAMATDLDGHAPCERIGDDLAVRVHRGSDGSLLHLRVGLRAWLGARFLCDARTLEEIERRLLANGQVNLDPPTAPDGGYDLVLRGRPCACCGEPT
jgi:hypothetical protein